MSIPRNFDRCIKPIGITVCVNYSDFLCWTIPVTRRFFKDWIIVTDTKDKKTQHLAKYYGLKLLVTDDFYKDGATFNKWAGINKAIQTLRHPEWVVFLDADIAVPDYAVRAIQELDKIGYFEIDKIYGVDRVNINSLEEYKEYIMEPKLFVDNWFLNLTDYQMGSRIVQYYGGYNENGKFQGYLPLGYFQMCHSAYFKEYPQKEDGADHMDVVFAKQYARLKRELIPDFAVIHLQSDTTWGINWNGRKSKQFD